MEGRRCGKISVHEQTLRLGRRQEQIVGNHPLSDGSKIDGGRPMSEERAFRNLDGRHEFDGKRILVTGGTRGIGAAIVHRLGSGGGEVLTIGRSLPSGTSHDGFVKADISTANGVNDVVSAVMDRLAGLDILIHNVGGSAARGGGSLALSDDDWQKAFDMNLFAAVRLDRAFLPSMLQQGSGVIMHISSIQRTLPLYDATLAYAAAKEALPTSPQPPPTH